MANSAARDFRCALAAGALCAGLALSTTASAVDLITDDEAKLPAAPKVMTRGGITRGPSIKVVSPQPDGQIKAPFA
ncbi:MAG: hypothetical protein K8S22_13950, partial [Betaproteobacteria bacterium]|nr:hypothetical protein [Betaproteobacteria bacterium]